MEIEIVDGFKFIKVGSSINCLLIDSERLTETIEYINNKRIKSIELNSGYGYKQKNIDFVKFVADNLEDITIVDGDINLKQLGSLNKLRKVFIGGENKCQIDFSNFKCLESCNVYWHGNLQNLNACKYLQELVIRKYSYNDKTRSFISSLRHLKKLVFIQGKFHNLELLQFFPDLEELEIYYNRSLAGIEGLRYCENSLRKLLLDHCKNVVDYEFVGRVLNLQYLGINDAAEVETLSFIKRLKKLEHLSFVGTNILDGNLSYCTDIKYVGFNNKKHYTHTYEEIKK